MWSTSRKDCVLRSSSLTLTTVVCVTIVYIYLAHAGSKQKMNKGFSSEDSPQPEKLTDEKCIPVCDSKECIHRASTLLRIVNPDINPCDDFRSFLCGGYEQKFGSDDRKSKVSETTQTMLKKLKDILDNLQAETESASAKMKIVYDSCMNYESSQLQNLKTFKQFLNDLGILNWPYLDPDFEFIDTNLPSIIGNFTAFREFHELRFSVPWRKENQTNDIYLKVYFAYKYFNESSKIPTEPAFHMLKYFDLGSEDIEIILEDHENVKNSILNLSKYDIECGENCSDIHVNCTAERDDDWRYLCETIDVFLTATNLHEQINKNSFVVDGSQAVSIKKLMPVLESLPDRAVANFFAINFLWKYLEDLNLYFRLSKLKFQENPKNEAEVDNWKYCVKWISKYMRPALEYEFVRQYFNTTVMQEVIDLYYGFTSESSLLIDLQEWFPENGTLYIASTIKNMPTNIDKLKQVYVVQPNENHGNNFFKTFHPTSENFFLNVLQVQKTITNFYARLSFTQTPEELYLTETAFKVDATADGEIIDLSFGIFFPPLYSPGLNKLMNQIPLAFVIGHEIGHNIIFMLEDMQSFNNTRDIFLKKQQCVEDQFSNFKFEILDENLNGTRYAIENLSDNTATTLVDKILEKYNSSQEDFLLPGLPYSTKQIIYMNAGQVWCAKSNLKEETHFKLDNPHAPSGFRLLGTMQNSKGYSEAFHCPVGSYMNPASKCSLLDVM